MKNIYVIVAGMTLIFSSCSSAYKTAQTPDDVYYSPGTSQKYGSTSGQDQYYNANADDQYLMMKSQDPNRWSYFDDYASDNSYYSPYYGYSPYSLYNPYMATFGLGYGFYGLYGVPLIMPIYGYGYGMWGGTYLNSYYMWNGLYNPFYGGVVVVNKNPAYNYYSQLHPFALTSYTGTALNNTNSFKSLGQGASRRSSFTNNSYNRFSNNSFYNSSSRFNPLNNSFRSQGTQSFRSFSPSSSFGGGSRSFGRIGR